MADTKISQFANKYYNIIAEHNYEVNQEDNWRLSLESCETLSLAAVHMLWKLVRVKYHPLDAPPHKVSVYT